MRRSFGLPLDRLGVLLAAVTLGYLLSSFSSGRVVARLGLGRVLSWSSFLIAVSLSLYALAPTWAVVLLGGVFAGLGAGAIDAGINAYAAHHFSAGRVSWLHACWGIGASLGPLWMSTALASGLGWRLGYAGLGLVLAGLAIAFQRTSGKWGRSDPTAPGGPAAALLGSLRERPVQANLALFFWYTGLEAGVGQWAFSLFTESRGFATAVAGTWVSAYWGSLTLGRMVSGALAERLGPNRLLRAGLAVAPIGALFVWARLGSWADALGLVLMGLALAPTFPLLIADTPRRVGTAHAANAVGFQVSVGYLGAALIPGAVGLVAQRTSVEAIAAIWLASALVLLLLHETLRLTTAAAARTPRPAPEAGRGPTT
jgi:fucose permease